MSTRAATLCPECGVPLPEYWPKGFCPQCSLTAALAVEEDAPDGEPASQSTGGRRFGDYELLEEKARGGMGVIYRARQIKLNRIVALKMILAGQFASKQEVLRFRSEAEAAANLQHPNVVSIHETGERDGHHYFSMDFVEGRTLAEIGRDGPLPAQRAAKYTCKIAEAMHYAHSRGVLHRDLKPSNVIIDSNDEPRITDFGLAKRVSGELGVTVTGQVLGTPNFMPPEQARSATGETGPRSDVYGIGAVLYFLLTGRPPFQAETIEELLLSLRDTDPISPRLLNRSVPHDLETICLKCLEKDPARRYASASELADELGRFIRDEPIHARPVGSLAKASRWCRRRPAVAALSAAVLLLLVAVTVSSMIAAWRVNRARTSVQLANRDLRHAVNLLELDRAEHFFNANDASFAVAHLAAMLRRDPSNRVAANRLVSALSQRAWAIPVTPPIRHSNRVTAALFGAEDRQLLSACADNALRLWKLASPGSPVTLHHPGRISSVRYSSNRQRIVTACADGSARIWNAQDGTLEFTLPHSNRVFWAEFSRDGQSVLSASADRTVRIWDSSTGALKRVLRGHTSHILFAHFSTDGRRVFTAGSHGSVRIWEAESGETIMRLEDRDRPLTSLELSVDGKYLASTCDDNVVNVFNAADGQQVGEPLAHTSPVWHVAFSPDAKFLLTTTEDGAARLWHLPTMQTAGEPLRHESGVIFGEFSPDGKTVLTTSSDNTARLWDVNTHAPLCQPLRYAERVLHGSFSSDGHRIVTASYDGIAQVWQWKRPLQPAVEAQHDRNVAPMAITPDGTAVLTLARDRTLRLWDLRTGKLLTKSGPQDGYAVCGVFAPAGKHFALGNLDGKIRVWDYFDSGEDSPTLQLRSLPTSAMRHGKRIRTLRFSPDGARILSSSADGTAQVWNATNGEPTISPIIHGDEVIAAEFSPDGLRVATASHDRTARIWDAGTGSPLSQPLRHIDHLKSVEWSPDGQRIVTASTDNTAAVWNASTGERLLTLQHARIVEHARFSPDGRRIATASLDRTVRLWDASTGQALTPAFRHSKGVARVEFSANNRQVFALLWGGQARVWDTETGRPVSDLLDEVSSASSIFEPMHGRIISAKTNGLIRVWKVPEAPLPVPPWFVEFAEACAGVRVAESGNLEFVPTELLSKRRETPFPTSRNDFYIDLAAKLASPD